MCRCLNFIGKIYHCQVTKPFDMASFMDLPEVVWIEILKKMKGPDRYSTFLACPQLRKVLKSGSIWVYTNLDDIDNLPCLFCNLLEHVSLGVKYLSMEHFTAFLAYPNEMYRPVSQFLRCFVNVKELSLTNCGSVGTLDFLHVMPHITKLNLDFVVFIRRDIFVRAVKSCTNLTHLSIRHIYQITESDVVTMSCSMPKLLFLDAQRTCSFKPQDIEVIFQHCPLLHTFHFSAYFFWNDFPEWIALVRVKYPRKRYLPEVIEQIKCFEKDPNGFIPLLH